MNGLTIKYGAPSIIALETSNSAFLFATPAACRSEFKVSMANSEEGHDDTDAYWFFDKKACEEAIKFFEVIRDDLVKHEES
jgi:hypothetical protein